jgi:hypothetical protein
MWDFFEQPWTLLGAAVIVLFVVLTFRSVCPERRRWWQWLLPVGVAALGLGLDLGVATDLEKIIHVMKTGTKATEQEDCAAIARLIAADYQDSFHKDRQSLLNRCRARLVTPAIERVRKVGVAVDIRAPEATVIFTMSVRFEPGSYWVRSYGKRAALVKAKAWLRKQPDRNWLVTRLEVLEVDTMPVNWGMAKESHTRQRRNVLFS